MVAVPRDDGEQAPEQHDGQDDQTPQKALDEFVPDDLVEYAVVDLVEPVGVFVEGIGAFVEALVSDQPQIRFHKLNLRPALSGVEIVETD